MKGYDNTDLFSIGVNGGKIDPIRALATYADEKNWGKIYDEKGCHWVWQGPVIVGFELAQWGITEK